MQGSLFERLLQITCVVSRNETCFSQQVILHTFRPTAELTSLCANKSQRKPSQIISDARNDPCCYAHVPCTSIKFSHSDVEGSFQKHTQHETLNPGFLFHTSLGFLRWMFKTSTDFIQFFFHEKSAFLFGSFLSSNISACPGR